MLRHDFCPNRNFAGQRTPSESRQSEGRRLSEQIHPEGTREGSRIDLKANIDGIVVEGHPDEIEALLRCHLSAKTTLAEPRIEPHGKRKVGRPSKESQHARVEAKVIQLYRAGKKIGHDQNEPETICWLLDIGRTKVYEILKHESEMPEPEKREFVKQHTRHGRLVKSYFRS